HVIDRRLAGGAAMVLDLGAHLGSFALPLAALGARVLAIDASPRNIHLLRASAVRNRFDNLEVVHAAANDSAGEVPFRAYGAQGSVVSPVSAGEEPVLDGPAVTVDDLLEASGRPEVA